MAADAAPSLLHLGPTTTPATLIIIALFAALVLRIIVAIGALGELPTGARH